MNSRDRWVAGILAAGIAAILVGVLVAATRTHIPVSHIYVNPAGAGKLEAAGEKVQPAPDWPGAFEANPRYSASAFTAEAWLTFPDGHVVRLPRKEILLWVYRG